MLITLGVSHKTAPIGIREKLAFSQENIPSALKMMSNQVIINEVALLSTCNRTEFYCSISASSKQVTGQISHWWREYCQPPFDMNDYLYTLSGEQAVTHLMRVASGLDSMIIGEPQILGQLKKAYQTAKELGLAGKKLSYLFQSSFSVAKSVRHQTKITVHPVSVAFSAVTLAKQIFSDLSPLTILLIGAGENIELTLRHLLSKKVKKIIIVNRTLEKAQKLTLHCEGETLSEVFTLEKLSLALRKADIVISSIDVTSPILKQDHIDEAFRDCKRRPIFMVDLGVPRNIDPFLAKNEDIYLYSIDDLQYIIAENLKNRQIAAIEAESIIKGAAQNVMQWLHLEGSQKVKSLRQNAQIIKNEMLAFAYSQLEKGENPKEVLSHLAHRLTQKLMHQPTVDLRNEQLKDLLEY